MDYPDEPARGSSTRERLRKARTKAGMVSVGTCSGRPARHPPGWAQFVPGRFALRQHPASLAGS